MVSSSTTSPVTHTSMLSSPSRKAASPSLMTPKAPVVLTTTMKEEDVSERSGTMSSMTPPAASQSGPRVPKAYVSDDPEHVNDCSNCGLSHKTRQALDPYYWPLVLVEQLAQEQDREARWNREGAEVKDKETLGRSQSTETDRNPLDRTCNVSSPLIKIEIKIIIEAKHSSEEGMEEERPKKKASGDQERECYNCHKIGHIKRQCPGRLNGKNRNNRVANRNKNRNKKSTKGNPQDRITRIEVVSNYEDYDNEGEADFGWYQGRD